MSVSVLSRIRDLKVTGYTEPFLGINNVTGTGLKGVVMIDPPKLPDPVPVPTQPYQMR